MKDQLHRGKLVPAKKQSKSLGQHQIKLVSEGRLELAC